MTLVIVVLVIAVVILAIFIVFEKVRGGSKTSSGELTEQTNEAIQTLLKLSDDIVQRVSLETASKSSEAVRGGLDTNFQRIDQRIKPLEEALKNNAGLISSLKEQASKNQGELTEQLKAVDDLNKIFSNPKIRGNWGEDQAENIINSAGFKKDIDYSIQQRFPNPKNSDGYVQPDFTFKLPENCILHMDAKFSLDNYLKALESEEGSVEAKEATKKFLGDVRTQIQNLSEKEYVETQNSVDQMLMFLPNESAFIFLVENDKNILDFAVERHITLCSPMTLFAVLRIVRQSVRTAQLRESSDEILQHHGDFSREFEKFIEALSKLGESIVKTHEQYDRLVTTRKNQLERPMKKIEKLQLPASVQSDEDEKGDIFLED